MSWPNSSRVGAGKGLVGATVRPSARPRCDSVATAWVSVRSGFVTAEMIRSASRVVKATTAITRTITGRAKLERSMSSRSAGSCWVCSTR